MEIDNFLPGSAALIDLIDKRLLVHLRDGRFITGILISYDQFANLVIDTLTGVNAIMIIRGENVVMVGELEGELKQMKTERREKNLKELHRLGFCVEVVPGDNY